MISKIRFIVCVLAVQLFVMLAGSADAFKGPLYIKNSHPMFVGIGSPYLDSAFIENSVDVIFTYSSTFVNTGKGEWSFGIDLEALVSEVRLKKVVNDKLELSLDIPVIMYWEGFLDGFLESFHNAFNFGDYGRSERPHDEFLFEVRRRGDLIIEGKSGKFAFGDLVIGAKEILYDKGAVISLKGFLDLPTGDANRGFGNGSLDWGLSLLADKALADNLMGYANFGMVFTEKYNAHEDIDLNNYLFGGAGIEWMSSRKTSIITQFFFVESPYETGVRQIDDIGSIWSIGSKHLMGKNFVMEFSFTEDINTAGAPDFMVAVGGSYKY